MTAKHTPGPWEMPAGPADKNTSDIFEVGDYNVYPPPGEAGPVAIVAGEANAHLISAAPAMLAALRAMVGVTINSGHVSDDMAPALEMALAVIKQATGDGE